MKKSVIVLIVVTLAAFIIGILLGARRHSATQEQESVPAAPATPSVKPVRQVEPPVVTEIREISPAELAEMDANTEQLEQEIRDAIGTNTFDYCDMNPCDKNGDAIPQGE